jgi:hypothetical protein
MAKITYLPGEVANAAVDENGKRLPVTRTHHIFDDALNKPQSQINEETTEAISDEVTRAQNAESGLDTRLQTVEQLAEISIGGGDIGIGTAADFESDDPSDLAKVPTIGAILGGANDGVYDVSKRNPTGGPNNDGKFTLEYILSNADTLIPTSRRHGGMIISFVQTSDNKYVQYRLIADSWSIDTNDWAFCGDSVYVENPEWIYVLLDAKKRILAGLKSDGSVEWSIGVPTPVKTYIDNAINEIKNGTEGTDLDGLNKIIAFLSEFSTSDTLKDLLDTKVDKEEGKSLIDEEYAEGVHYEENPEFIKVELDADNKIIKAIKNDGTEYFGVGIDIAGVVTEYSVDNPEYISVILDEQNRVLLGIKKNGDIHFGAGIPVQIQDYLEREVMWLNRDIASIQTFLAGFESGTTLFEYLNDTYGEYVDNPEFIEAKVDAEDKVLEGIKIDGTKVIGGDLNVGGSVKILGNMEVSGVSYKVIENPEYIAAWLDAEDKVIFGFKTDGKTYVGDADFLNDIKNNQEAIGEINAIIASISSTIEPLDINALTSITATENPEFMDVELDTDDKILGGRKVDGTKFENNNVELNGNATVGGSLEVDGAVIKNIEDPENRSEVTLDDEEKIISYRKDDGTLVENVGIESPNITTDNLLAKEVSIESGEATLEKATLNSLELTNECMTEFQQALINAGFNPKDKIDWSDSELVEIPIPQVCAIINLGVDSQATSKSDRQDYNPGVNADIPTTLEYWDMNGNYFKKPILLSAQGNSSMKYWIKNQAFDLDDGSSIKFGNWVPQDSFHIKKYYQDAFRGQCIVGYWLTEQVYQTKPYGERKPWDYLNQGGDTLGGIGKMNKDFETGALAHPDGFPVHVFFNGKDAGVYAFNLKKHRDNYWQKKDNTNHIILDGDLELSTIFGGTIDWTAFEIRNPKTKKKKDGWELVDTDGDKYDGDFPKELMGTTTPGYDSTNLSHVKSAATKDVIERLSGAYAAINDAVGVENKKTTFESYFNVPFFIDYFLISNVLWHQDGFAKNWIWCTWDGLKWTPTVYDLDSIFGAFYRGTYIVPAGAYINPSDTQPNYWVNTNTLLGCKVPIVNRLWDLYSTDIKARYKELRDNGVFTTNNIVRLLENWLDRVGYDNLKNDIEKICAYDDVPQTPSYRDGSATYSQFPETGGFYNSILRVKRWLDEHFTYLDSENILNYNQN